MKLLVTGGTGFIGSHTVVELLNANYEVVILDDLSNSKREVLDAIKKITGKSPIFYEGNVANQELLRAIFKTHEIGAVIHFAGFKAVGESVKNPLKYYDNNLISTIHLLEVMNEFHCQNLVFSSSATVYGSPKELPIKEDAPLSTTNPYGTTKLMIEQILRDLVISDSNWSIALLRYFNPIGAHESGLIGENPNDTPNNLMPYLLQVASGIRPYLNVYGSDYDTSDGTGVRDYIHVVDLAQGHLKALSHVVKTKGIGAYNLGTGRGYSVLEVVKTFEQVTGVSIPYQMVPRRSGDIAACYADSSLAFTTFSFKATKSLEEMCRDAYRYMEGVK